ncbi:hypothetical protein GEMRC1_011250 [Eukaryota sp. GEM-RC1]
MVQLLKGFKDAWNKEIDFDLVELTSSQCYCGIRVRIPKVIPQTSDASVHLLLSAVICGDQLEEAEGSNNIMLAPWVLPPRKTKRTTGDFFTLTHYCHALVPSSTFSNFHTTIGRLYYLLRSEKAN